MQQKSIQSNTVYNLIKLLSAMLFALITFPYISRVLLPDNVGKINFGLSIVSYFSLIASLGITTYAIRECATVREDKDRLSNTASQIFSISIIATFIAYLALGVTLFYYQQLDNYRVLIIIQSLSILFSTLGADWLNQAMEDFKYIALRTLAFQFLSLILMFIFVLKPEDYMNFAVISLISASGANIVNIWYRRRFCKVRFIWRVKTGIEWKKHMVPIFYLFVMIMAQTIFNSVDVTMLGVMRGDFEVGIYCTANKMIMIVAQIVASLLWVILPRMSQYFANGNYDEINVLLRKVLGFHAFLGIPCLVGTFMLSDEIVLIIAGNKFAEASVVLRILVIGMIFTLFGGSFIGNTILLPSKKEKMFMVACCIAAAVNVIANYIFIPMYGAIAAAGTTSLCAVVIFLLLSFSIDKKIKITNIFRLFFTPVLGGIAIVISCVLLRNIDTLWLRFILSAVLGATAYFLVNYYGKNELLLDFVLGLKNKLTSRS